MKILKHRFVDKIPVNLEEGILYVSIQYATAIHKCCCGCGNEVVTPISPTDWSLIFNGESITLDPSIGNWSLECQSHYFIKKNRVIWSRKYSDAEIDEVKKTDIKDKYDYFLKLKNENSYRKGEEVSKQIASKESEKFSLIKWIKYLLKN